MGKSIIVRDPDKLSQWKARITECQSSGQQVGEWCLANGLSIKTYYYWHQKIKKIANNLENESRKQYYDISNIVGTGSVVASIHIGTGSADIYCGADEAVIASIVHALKSC